MINVIRDGTLKFGSRLGVRFLQFGNLRTLLRIKFFGIKSFQDRFGSIILREKVITESTLVSCLQSRTIRTETYQVILPSKVIKTLGVIFTASNHIKGFRSTRLNGISGRTISFHRSRENNLFIVCHLIGNLLSVRIKHYNLCRVRQFQLRNHIAHRYFHHLPCTL